MASYSQCFCPYCGADLYESLTLAVLESNALRPSDEVGDSWDMEDRPHCWNGVEYITNAWCYECSHDLSYLQMKAVGLDKFITVPEIDRIVNETSSPTE